MSRVFTIVIILTISLANCYGMRCNGGLISEGDSIYTLISMCGTPTVNTLSHIEYVNKDGDGMNYYIHANANGIIDSINFSKE